MNGPWDCNRLTHPSGAGTVFNFPRDFNHVLFAQDITFVLLLKPNMSLHSTRGQNHESLFELVSRFLWPIQWRKQWYWTWFGPLFLVAEHYTQCIHRSVIHYVSNLLVYRILKPQMTIRSIYNILNQTTLDILILKNKKEEMLGHGPRLKSCEEISECLREN